VRVSQQGRSRSRMPEAICRRSQGIGQAPPASEGGIASSAAVRRPPRNDETGWQAPEAIPSPAMVTPSVIASSSTDGVRDIGEKRGVGWILRVGFQQP
jgi:hypothetical protein